MSVVDLRDMKSICQNKLNFGITKWFIFHKEYVRLNLIDKEGFKDLD